MRAVLVVLAVLLLLIGPAQAGSSPPRVALSIHVQTTGGLSANEASTVLLPPNGEAIQIRTIPEVTERNLVAVTSQGAGTLLSFDHVGQVNLSAVTAQNQGRILVVLLDGYIIYAPLIDEQLANGQLLLPHALAPPVVKLLQEQAQKNVQDSHRT